jgi:hypothetical protein
MGSDVMLYERMKLESVPFYSAYSLEAGSRPTGYTLKKEKEDFVPLVDSPLNFCG